jgi:hypothetical protein
MSLDVAILPASYSYTYDIERNTAVQVLPQDYSPGLFSDTYKSSCQNPSFIILASQLLVIVN